MKPLFAFFVSAIFCAQNLDAQHFAWARPLSSTSNAVTTDQQGNSLFLTDNLPDLASHSREARLLNPAGETIWAKNLGSDFNFLAPAQTDASGNFYLQVRGLGDVEIDGIQHFFESSKASALAKLRPDGTFDWIGFDTPIFTDFEFDGAGNLYSSGNEFLQKRDAAGQTIWQIENPKYANGAEAFWQVFDLELVTDEVIVVAGDFTAQPGVAIQIADTSLIINEIKGHFLAAFDQNGQRLWLKAGGTYYFPSPGEGSLAHDASGHVYFGFNPFSLDWEGLQLPSDGGANGPAIIKIDAKSGEQIWIKNYPKWSWLNGISASPDGAIFLAGELRNANFPGEPIVVNGIAHERKFNYQAFAARFDTDGNPQWLALSEGSDGARFDKIEVGANGLVWASGSPGWYFGQTFFGFEKLHNLRDGYGVAVLLVDSLAQKPAQTFFLEGKIFDDASADCLQNSGEKGLEGMTVLAEPGPFLTKTDALGQFKFELPPGNYALKTVAKIDPAERLEPLCQPLQTVDLQANTSAIDFPFQVENCASLSAFFDGNSTYITCVGAEPQSPADSSFQVQFLFNNLGSKPIAQADFKVKFAWPFYPVSSEPYAWQTVNFADSSLLFSFQNLAPGSADTLKIRFGFACDLWWNSQFPQVWEFPFSAKFSGETNDCLPADSVFNQWDWTVQYFIPVGTASPASSEFQVNVAPNPSADGVFSVKTDVEKPVRWEVLDSFGRRVLAFENRGGGFGLDLKGQAPGVYFLLGRADDGLVFRALVLF